MKTLVVYQSCAGSTQKYAEDIAKQLGGDCMPVKKVKSRIFSKYDTVIFGGWIENGLIKGLNEFLSNWDTIEKKNVLVFANGISVPTPENRKSIIQDNLLDLYHLRFYHLRGSFNLLKLKFPYSLIVKLIIKKIEKNPNAPLDQRTFLELRDHPVEYYDYEGIEKICSVVRKLDSLEA